MSDVHIFLNHIFLLCLHNSIPKIYFNFFLLGCNYLNKLNETWILLLNAKKAIKEKINFLEINQISSKFKDSAIVWLEKNRFTDSPINTEIDEFSYVSVGGNLQKLVEEGQLCLIIFSLIYACIYICIYVCMLLFIH